MAPPADPKKEDYPRVPYGLSVHGDAEIEAVVNVLRSSTQMGEHVREFEAKIAKLFAKQHGVMVNSGSTANLLATQLLDLQPGAEVITPALTFSTTVAPLVQQDLVPSFVDVEPGTYNVNVAQIEEMITPQTAALMIPSLIGNLPDWDAIAALADEHDLAVIEDSADTLGATLRGESTGTRSDISTTSFYGSHIINCAGNGGMLCFNSDDYLRQAKLLRGWGRSSSLVADSESLENRFNVSVDGIPYDAKFVFEDVGYNFLPSEAGAAFGLVQLERLEENVAARMDHFNAHLDFFGQYEEWFILPRQLETARTGWLAFPLTIREEAPFTRRAFQIFLEKRNIQTRTVFTGNILRQPGFADIEHRARPGGYPVSDEVMRRGVLIGCHHGLGPTEMGHLHDTVRTFLSQW